MAQPLYKNKIKKSEPVGRTICFLYRALAEKEAPPRVQWCNFLWGILVLGTLRLVWNSLVNTAVLYCRYLFGPADHKCPCRAKRPKKPSVLKIYSGKTARLAWRGLKLFFNALWIALWPLRKMLRPAGVNMVTALEKVRLYYSTHIIMSTRIIIGTIGLTYTALILTLIGIGEGWLIALTALFGIILLTLSIIGLCALTVRGYLSWIRAVFNAPWTALKFTGTLFWVLAVSFKYRFCPVSELVDE